MENDSMSMGGFWGFLIFAILLGGGNFFGGGNNGNANAIQADVNRGFDNQNLQAQTRDLMGAVTAGTAQSVAATNQVFHDLANVVQDKYGELQRDIAGVAVGQANLLANQNQCCCSTKMEIAQNRYENAMNTAAINATTTAQTQKILDALAQNKIEALQGKVNSLELANALSGVVRYPNGMTYNAGPSPFCACGVGYPVI